MPASLFQLASTAARSMVSTPPVSPDGETVPMGCASGVVSETVIGWLWRAARPPSTGNAARRPGLSRVRGGPSLSAFDTCLASIQALLRSDDSGHSGIAIEAGEKLMNSRKFALTV